jgi:hypothetical protein
LSTFNAGSASGMSFCTSIFFAAKFGFRFSMQVATTSRSCT